jgi:small subunit ribosomal protein S9e
LKLEPKDPKRLFEGHALLRRMLRYKLLNEDEKKLDFVLGLTLPKLMERRL